MTITPTVYDTSTLLGVMVDDDMMEPPSNYWLGLGFGSTVQFDDEFIDFSKLQENRKIAPLVVPTAQGVPIYSAAEKLSRVKAAYVKPKDAVSASRVIKRVAGFGELGSTTPMSPAQRYNAIVSDILRQHRRAIERRWEWLAAEATLNGSVTLVGENYPEVVVDFERDAGQTVVLTGGNRWGDAGVSIMGLIEAWKKTMRRAKHGGAANRITVGADAWEVMRQDAEIRELLKTDYAPGQKNGLDINLGVLNGGHQDVAIVCGVVSVIYGKALDHQLPASGRRRAVWRWFELIEWNRHFQYRDHRHWVPVSKDSSATKNPTDQIAIVARRYHISVVCTDPFQEFSQALLDFQA